MRRIPDGFEGPLYSVFGGPVARVLDEARIVGNMEQTVSMLAELTRLDYKTVQGVLERLIRLGLVKQTRKIGNARAYRFDVENELHPFLEWSEDFQHRKRKRR